MINLPMIEQAIVAGEGSSGNSLLARSAGFREEWVPEAQRLCTGFGQRPAETPCPSAVFARPLEPGHVAVVRVADQGCDDAGRPLALAFHLLVLPRNFYQDLGGDPFLISEQFPPSWLARQELPALCWAGGPPPRRTLAQLQ